MKKIIPLAAVLLLLFSSCLKETIDDINGVKGIKASPAWGLPLFNVSLGMNSLVKTASDEGQVIEVDPNKRLILKLNGRDSTGEKSFLALPEVDVHTSIHMPAPSIPVFESTGSFSATTTGAQEITTNNNEQVQRVWVKEGNIEVNITSQFRHDVKIKVIYPSITKNTVPLVDSFILVYNGTPPVIQRTTSLDGYLVDFTDNGTTVNKIPYRIEVNITRNPSNTVLLTDEIIVDQAVKVTSYTRADGYFGQIEILNYDEVNNLAFFDKKLDGNVFIKDPVLRLAVENGMGMPITGKITEIYVESGSGNKVPVVIDAFKDTFNLGYTTVVGGSVVTEYIIDKNNSNIEDVISAAPQKILYTVSFVSNSDNVVKDNVLTENSTMKVLSTLELPFDLRILYYAMQETGPFSLDEKLESLDTANFTIEWAELSTDVVNELPLNSFIQVYFEDSVQGIVLDSLFDEPYRIQAAGIDAQGKVISNGKAFTTSFFNKEQFDRIRYGNKYRLTVWLRTAEENSNLPFVTFYDYQKVNARIGLKTKVKYKTTF